MLHIRIHKNRMVIMIKQLMPECTSCVARVLECARVYKLVCPSVPECGTGVCLSVLVQELTEEMAERISAAIGQENTTRPNERNVEQK